ncbi:MAG: hypothetical protein ACI90V_014211, partial [Bacillariaceae sp.]
NPNLTPTLVPFDEDEDEDEEQLKTSSPMATVTSQPSLRPSLSDTPAISPEPTRQPTVLSCKDESLNIIQQMQKQNGDDGSDIAVRLKEIENKMMVGDNNNDNSGDADDGSVLFAQHCSGINKNVTECIWDYEDIIIPASATTTEVDEQTQSIASLCTNKGNFYVEDSVSITCTSTNSSSSIKTTRLIIRNKPSCRSDKCNADGVIEIATIEFQRWIRMALNKGKLLEENTNYNNNIIILDGLQSCDIDDSENIENDDGVFVAVGGSTIFLSGDNDVDGGDGDDIIGAKIERTTEEECKVGTNKINNSLIEIYNHKIWIVREFMNYIDTDLHQICDSPKPNSFECNFDWNEVFTSSLIVDDNDDSDLKSLCMPPDNNNSDNNGGDDSTHGQYIELTYQLSCTNADGTLVITNKNVPSCVSKLCNSPSQIQYILKDNYVSLEKQFVDNNAKDYNWSCTTEYMHHIIIVTPIMAVAVS